MNFENIANEAISFYHRLYKKDPLKRPIIDNLFDSHLSNEQVTELERPFDVEEIKEAIFGMDGAKSLGLDGFYMLFYQEYWNNIKDDIMKVLEEFY